MNHGDVFESSQPEQLSEGAPNGPAPVHHNHFSRERQVTFLEALALWGNVRAACRAAAIAAQTAYRQRHACREFALGWQAALLAARPQVEDALADRALNGVEEPVFYHGEEVARRRRYEGRLLLAHLARLDRIEESEAALAVVDDFNAALARLARGERLSPRGRDENTRVADAYAEDGYGEGDDDESLPIVERALRFIERRAAEEDASLEEWEAETAA